MFVSFNRNKTMQADFAEQIGLMAGDRLWMIQPSH
jgi:hypothetical protein